MPRFSIVITCYNQGGLIKEAVDSALGQTNSDREIIVVDDCSTDDSRRVLESYVGLVRLELSKANHGVVAARNRGASLASGDFLVFLDGDDRLLPWALDVYDRVVERKAPRLILATMLYFTVSPGGAAEKRPDEIKVVVYGDYFGKDRAYRASASAMVVDRRTFLAVGGWTPGTFPADDQDLLFKLGCAGSTVQILSPETSAYRLHADNATRNTQKLIDALYGLLGREKGDRYPGGNSRRFDRHAVMGGFVFFMVKQAWRNRLYGGSLGLLAVGWRMVLAAMLRRIALRLMVRRRRTEDLRLDELI